jgi:hypothetical protein
VGVDALDQFSGHAGVMPFGVDVEQAEPGHTGSVMAKLDHSHDSAGNPTNPQIIVAGAEMVCLGAAPSGCRNSAADAPARLIY